MSYELNVISQHPQFKGRALKKYAMAGLEHIGVWGNEPFEVVFKNNTWQKVQVRLSIDGTDILTGKPADTQATGQMWVVNGYGTLSLKAWPETTKGGAQFIFTTAEKSVALNTHGDLSSRGVIAAAVYTEGYVAPPIYTIYNNGYTFGGGDFGSSCRGIGGTYSSQTLGNALDGVSFNNCSTDSVASSASSAIPTSSMGETKSSNTIDTRVNARSRRSLESLAAVGAGQHVQQNIQTATGLIQPVLGPIVRVRYMWWDELVQAARETGLSPMSGSGFPGEEKRMISLGSTPRIGSWNPPAFPVQEFSRF